MKIFLIGAMGSGKSTIGKLVASQLHLPFHDMDQALEEEQGTSISNIFQNQGEAHFRALETSLLQKMISLDAGVISTGGGIVLGQVNRTLLLNEKLVIHLQVSLENQLSRLEKDNSRPLLDVENRFKKLGELKTIRDPLYDSVAKYVVNTDALQITDVFQTTISLLSEL